MMDKLKGLFHKFTVTGVMIAINSVLMVYAFFPLIYLLFFKEQGAAAFLKAGLVILLEVILANHFFKLPEPKLICVMPFAIMYILGLVFGRSILYRTMFYLTAADLIVIFVYTYFHGFDQFLKYNDSISDMPVSYMRKVQKAFFAVACLIVIAVMIPVFRIDTEPLASYFDNTNRKQQEATVSEEEQQARWDEEANFSVSDGGYSEYFDELIHIPKWLLNIADTAFGLLVFAFIFYLLYKLIRSALKDLMEYEKFETDEVTYLDNADDAMSMYTKEESESLLDRLITSRQSVRRKYKNAIKKGTKGRINASCSPTELEIAAGLKDNAAMQDLHIKYESVRYGDNEAHYENA